jgi:hypothetical protein
MNALESAALAVRVLGVSVALLLLPGVMLLQWLQLRVQWDRCVVLGFALSYSWIFVLSIVIPLFELNADVAGGLTLVLLAVLGSALARGLRRGQKLVWSSERSDVWLILVIVLAALAAWMIEPPFTGEEALDLASISRFADGGPISFDNTSLLPDARAVYVFQPYQLALGLIARWSWTEPIVALIKFRAFLAPLALVLLYSLIRSLTLTRIEASSAFLVALLFVVFDMNTWEWNSLFPFVRRGGVGAGICVPAMLVLCLIATRRVHDPDVLRVRRLALLTAPVMLLASLATHPLEMFTLLCFLVGMTCTILAGLDRAGARKQAVLLMLLLSVATGAYAFVQARFVPYVAEYERHQKVPLRAELIELVQQPTTAIAGGPTDAREILSRTVPATSALVGGIPALALAALRAPATATMLALGIVPLALLYASPAGYIVIELLTSVETARDVNAYFSLLGLLALAIGLTALAQAGLHAATTRHGVGRLVATSAAGSFVVWAAWIWGRNGVRTLASRTTMQPEFLLLVAVIVAAVVLVMAALRPRPIVPPAPLPWATALATLCLAVPFVIPEWGFGGVFTKREAESIFHRFDHTRASPSVVDWGSYYEGLKQSIAPPLPVPRVVIDALQKHVPPRQVVLADPRYSCALVVLIDAYCINPDSIYGHYFQPAARYHTEYVTAGPGDVPIHPFFNATTSLTSAEARLLEEYRVSYVLADPVYAEAIAGKLREIAGEASLEFDVDGYQLYRIGS